MNSRMLLPLLFVSISSVFEATSEVPACSDGRFLCDNIYCIEGHFRCDGKYDCADFTDELGCQRGRQPRPSSNVVAREGPPRTCTGGFICRNTGRCIPQDRLYRLCNGKDDCGDWADERNCTLCRPLEAVRCESTSQCISLGWACDYFPDCADYSDETEFYPHFCPQTLLQRRSRPCVATERRCGNGRCMWENRFCDGNNDCGDWSDERNCHQCRTGFLCAKEYRCIPSHYCCDGTTDCYDNSDEIQCPFS